MPASVSSSWRATAAARSKPEAEVSEVSDHLRFDDDSAYEAVRWALGLPDGAAVVHFKHDGADHFFLGTEEELIARLESLKDDEQ